jgi:RNA polymerase sigma-70 factor (ECF subfamily)
MLFRPHRQEGSDAADRGADPFEAEALSHVDALFGTAMRLTRNPADAEDLVQETFFRAFRASRQFERGTNLKAWLFTILHNTFRNQLRHASRDPIAVDSEVVELAEARPGYGDTPEQQLLRGTLDVDLQEALDALSPGFRQAVWLRDVEEFSYAEIAAMLEIPLGTVMSRISRGRRALYQHLSAGARTA